MPPEKDNRSMQKFHQAMVKKVFKEQFKITSDKIDQPKDHTLTLCRAFGSIIRKEDS